MQKKHSIKTIAEFFLDIEEEFNLIHYEIDGIKVWQYQRYRIFLGIARQLGLYESAHIKRTSVTDIFAAAPSLLFYSLFSNPIAGWYQKDTLVFSAGRKVKLNHRYIDIYTEYFVNELKEGSFEIIEELYLNKHLSNERKNRKHQDYQAIRTFVLSKFSSFKLTRSQLRFIDKIEKRIMSDLGVEVTLKQLFRNGYLAFKYDFEFYDKLIRKRKPKQIFMVCSYGYKMALVAAAKKNRVETVEIQHGTMNKFHFGYSYPSHNNIDYFPDKIYFFGAYWKACMHFPIKEENKIVYGFPYFQGQKEKPIEIIRKQDSVLVISQGTIGNKLCEFIWNNRDAFRSFKVTYKLHPGEYERWKTDYKHLVKLDALENFTVIDNNAINLYRYFAQSEFVLGVYSTALYEALSFGCKVVLANLPGVEYLDDLVAKEIVKLANNRQELEACFTNGGFKSFNPDYFFA